MIVNLEIKRRSRLSAALHSVRWVRMSASTAWRPAFWTRRIHETGDRTSGPGASKCGWVGGVSVRFCLAAAGGCGKGQRAAAL